LQILIYPYIECLDFVKGKKKNPKKKEKKKPKLILNIYVLKLLRKSWMHKREDAEQEHIDKMRFGISKTPYTTLN